jgi:WD40 repeat protein
MAVAFSRSGHLLAVAAAASTGGGGAYHLRIYDPDLLVEVAAAAYCHQGPIYEVKWSLNDRYLLTCSGDGCVKVWDLLGMYVCVIYNYYKYSTHY